MSRPSGAHAVAGVAVAAIAGYVLMSAILAGGGSGLRGQSGARRNSRGRPGSTAQQSPPTTREAGQLDSPAAAVVVATTYVNALGQAQSDPAAESQLVAHTVDPLRAQALHALTNERALANRLSREGPAYLHGWLLGWRVDDFSPGLARVSVWTIGVAEAVGAVVSPDWSTTACTLQQIRGRWKVISALTAPGPVPPPDGSDPGSIVSFVRAALTFHAYANATQ